MMHDHATPRLLALGLALVMLSGCGKDEAADAPTTHEPSAGSAEEEPGADDEKATDDKEATDGEKAAAAGGVTEDPAVLSAVTGNLDSGTRALQRCVDAAWSLGQWPPEAVQVRMLWTPDGPPQDFAAVDGKERPISGILAECLESRIGRLAKTWRRPLEGKVRVAHPLALKLPKRPEPSIAALTEDGGRFLYDLRATPKNRKAAELSCRKRMDETKVQPDPKKGGPNQMLDACIRAMARATFGQGIRFEVVPDDPDSVVWTFFQPKKPGDGSEDAPIIVQASSKASVNIADNSLRLGRIGEVTGTKARDLGDQHQTMVVRFLDKDIITIEGGGDETVYVRGAKAP